MRTERLGRWTIIIVLLAALMAVIGGIVAAVIWRPGPEQEDPCSNPPCFGGAGGPPTFDDMPAMVPMALLGAAALLGAITLLLTLVTPRTRNRRGVMLGALAAAGTLAVIVGGEALPHLFSPCVPANLWGGEPPGICEQTPYGWDLPGRWHLLYHALVGFLPLSLILAWRWKVSAGGSPKALDAGS